MKHESSFPRLTKTIFAAFSGFILCLSGASVAQAQRAPAQFYGGYGYYSGYGAYYPVRRPTVTPPASPAIPVVSPIAPVAPPVANLTNVYMFEFYGLNGAMFLNMRLEARPQPQILGQGSAIATLITGNPPNPYFGETEYASIKIVNRKGEGHVNCFAFVSAHKPTYTSTRGDCSIYPGDIVLITHQEPERLRVYDALTGVHLPVARTVRYQVTESGHLVLYYASAAYIPSRQPELFQYRLPSGSWTGELRWLPGTEW
jgi:hypothetical protein